jgi:hypothetical protein
MKIFLNLIVFAGLVLMTACGSVNIMPIDSTPNEAPLLSTPSPAPSTQGEPTQMNLVLPTPSASDLESLIEKAKEDLAQRLTIPISDIGLVEAKAVIWSDSSIGCPQPGMLYAQVLTPGYLVKLKYDSRNFEYHAGKGGALTYCENPLPPVEGIPDNT